MKKILILILAWFGFHLFGYGQTSKQSGEQGRLIIDERDHQENVEQIIPIDKVWSGHPVGFALLTDKNRQYIAYYNADRHTVIGQRNLDETAFELSQLPPKERESKEGTSTILGWDSHNSLTMAIDNKGYIHLSGNMHVNGLTYFRSTRPSDISTLIQVKEMIGNLEKRCTYPKFIKTIDGKLIFRYRDGGSGNGNEIYNIYDSETQKWSRLLSTPLIDGQGLMNAYASTPELGPDDWYHMYWVWRNTPDCATNHDLSYMKSPDMQHWYNVYGEEIKLPATFADKSLIVDPIPVGGGIINLAAKLCFDEKMQPTFAYHKYGPKGNLQLYRAKFNNRKWDIKQFTEWDYRWQFSGRGSINTEVNLGDFALRKDGYYELGYSHIKYGTSTFLLDSNLVICGTVLKPDNFANTLPLEGDFPGLEIRTSNDLGGESDPHVKYVLKWETLPANRDKPRPKPWPDPSNLTLYKLVDATPVIPTNKGTWQDITTVDEVCHAYRDRMEMLMQSINLNQDGLVEVKTAYDQNNLPLACKLILEYYQNGTQAQLFRRNLPTTSNATEAAADSIIQDIFTVQMQAGRAPRNQNGHLDWTFQGPLNDMEWAWGLNRHYHLRTLLDTYFATGNPKYVKTIDHHIKDWILSSLPYPEEKSGTAMWRGLEVSFRVKIWAKIFYRLIQHQELSAATRLLLLSSIPEHAHYARNFHAAGNWLTMELSGLATAATVWPEFKSAPSWLNYTKTAMEESLKEQVYPDGVQTELTSHYHYVALNNFTQFLEICQAAKEPLPDLFTNQIELMWNYLAYSMRPDGYGALNNDSDRDYNRERIMAASAHFDRTDWQYMATHGKEGQKPTSSASMIFPWAGQLIMRENFTSEAQWAFFDIGPWGSGHQHNDKLHISISAYGHDFLVDAGRFAYRGAIADKFRSFARGSQGHNVVLIDGKGQAAGPKVADHALPEKHYQITENLDYAWNDMNTFKDLSGDCRHTRAVCYLRGKFWIVVDNIKTDRPRKIETLWHWHPDCSIQSVHNNILWANHGQGNLGIIPVGSPEWDLTQIKGQEEPQLQGWYSEAYNQAEANTTSVYTTSINENASFIWLIYPSEHGFPKVITEILSRQENGVELKITDERGSTEVVFVPFSDSSKIIYSGN